MLYVLFIKFPEEIINLCKYALDIPLGFLCL